jgi:hypothetical protein
MDAPFALTGPDPAYVLAWLRRFGGALWRGKRQGVTWLDDGRVQLVVEYPDIGDLLRALQEIDALQAMVKEDAAEDAAATAAASGSPQRPARP